MATENAKSSYKSSKIRLIWLTAVLLVSLIALWWFMKAYYIERFFINEKVESMIRGYKEMNKAAEEGTFYSDEFDQVFRKICETNNVNIIVRDTESKMIKTSSKDYDKLARTLMAYVFNLVHVEYKDILYSNDSVSIFIITDNDTSYKYIDMWGTLNDGNLFLMRSPMDGIHASADETEQLINYIFVALSVAMVFGAVISIRRITISELRNKNIKLENDIRQKEELENMRSEFLSNVSHELKTPIALIQGYAEGLKEGINDEESKDYYCEVIMDEASKINKMVVKLLDINHLEFGDVKFEYSEFDIVALTNEYLQDARILCAKKGITITYNSTESIFVNADENHVEEAINNYITNAIHYVSGDMVINVKTEIIDNKLRFSVFNTGEPIKEDALSHIWEKFYKVDKARTREYGGSGIGLSIVKAIMDNMGQEYGVNNFADGVEFYFTLTLSQNLT